MGDNSDSDNSDEWGMHELVIPSKCDATADDDEVVHGKNNNYEGEGEADDYWAVEASNTKEKKKDDESKTEQRRQQLDEGGTEGGEPMIIVDMTQINPDIHSKFDRNSVNNPEEASALRKIIENNYEEYSTSPAYLSEGTVIPCGTSVWRDALIELRNDRKGHYFIPIFCTKKKELERK